MNPSPIARVACRCGGGGGGGWDSKNNAMRCRRRSVGAGQVNSSDGDLPYPSTTSPATTNYYYAVPPGITTKPMPGILQKVYEARLGVWRQNPCQVLFFFCFSFPLYLMALSMLSEGRPGAFRVTTSFSNQLHNP